MVKILIDLKLIHKWNLVLTEAESIEIELSENQAITSYDHANFKYLSEIGSGATATVFLVNWKHTPSLFAIKKFHDMPTVDEIVNEVC